MVAGMGEGGNGDRVSVWDDQKALEMNSGNDCTLM